MENKKLRIALRLAVEHIACCSDTCYYCDDNWKSKCQCKDDYCSDDCLKLIETCLLNEADELIRKEDVQTCRMFDITMDELKGSNSKEVCYACGYDAEDLVEQLERKDFQIKGLVEIYVKDKISFAVEQLEKVKEFANKEKTHDFISEIVYLDDLFNYINNQIKSIKKGETK